MTIGSGSLIAPSITAAGASANLLHIGAIGMTSSLTVSPGGSLTAAATTVANLAGEVGSANLIGGAWSGDYLYAGYRGQGSFAASGGAAANFAAFVTTGSFAGSAGTITLSGAGTTWYNGNGHIVGESGQGTYQVLAGAKADDRAITAGYNATGVGAVTVSGATWNIRGTLMGGYAGRGDIVISNGSSAAVTVNTNFGEFASGRGSLTIDGAGTKLKVGGYSVFGMSGQGSGLVSNGAVVQTNQGILAWQAGSRGDLRVTGANSQWLGTTYLMVGNLGVAEATIDNGGTVRIDDGRGMLVIANSAGSTGTVNIGAAAGAVARAPGFIEVAEIRLGRGSGRLVFNHTASNYTVGATITGTGAILHESGTTTLSGINTFRGTTTVNGGSLIVNGSLAASSGLTVAAGARLGGSGQLPSTVVNGTLAPGNSPGTLTVNGTLTMGAGSVYEAEIQGAVADRVNVTGTASLAGTLRLVALGGPYSFTTRYTLLSAQGGLGGTRFGTLDSTGPFGAGIATSLAYTANDVMLTLAPKPLAGFVASLLNAFSVAAGLDRAVAGGADPSALFGIYNLPAAAIPGAVNQLSGEAHTAAPAMAVSAADQFLRAMLDPFAAGRGSAGAAPGEASFSGLVRKGADAPTAPAFLDPPPYTVWGAAFGSVGRTDGSTRVGSAKSDLDDAHLAVGADFRIMPGTVAGFAVSGGSARSSLAGGLGKAEADVFQAGLYGTTRLGPVNLAAAFGYGRLENEIKRSIPVLGSALSSSYATTAWSGRLQASAAVLSWNGLTLSPLAALQAIQARSPGLIEANWAGANAGALALARRNDITSRSELGLQLDYANSLNGLPVAGYLRASWAHYYQRDAGLSASIAGLTGSGFAVEGARPARNSALLAAGLDLRLSPSVTLGARLDGELSGSTNRLGGQAQVRVSF
ncbi:autotransporter domain-containing protein [Bosea sp. 2YAB26]|uniref:autotransporter outer membrane beta-barrel domain-containing protein n=1 Tax=Bosea sp. 2YAB26 TaxID=3237478 RepID=UPI003F9301B9